MLKNMHMLVSLACHGEIISKKCEIYSTIVRISPVRGPGNDSKF
jgi:hypothetical protein